MKKTYDLVSIIIPVYNTDQFLLNCIDSCLAQSYSDIEVLAINDGSTDNSGTILDTYAEHEPRLRVFHQPNLGVATARNTGIRAAKGKWLMFVDSDDYIPLNAVSILYDCATIQNADIVSGIFCTDTKGSLKDMTREIVDTSSKQAIACALLQEKLTMSLCGKIFKASLFKDITICEHLKIGEDAYLVIQLCQNAERLSLIADVVYYYVQRDNSVMHRPNKSALASRLVFIDMVMNFYSTKEYYAEKPFEDAMAWFILKEYFAYLRMGGEYVDIPPAMTDRVRNNILQNKVVISTSPSWRVMMLKSYMLNPFLGNIYRYCFVKLRSLLR